MPTDPKAADPKAAEPAAAAAPAVVAPPPVAAADVLPPPAAPAAVAAPATPEPIEVKLPDGTNLVGTRLDEYKAIFADAKLTRSQSAQAVIDLNAKWVKEDLVAAAAGRTKAIEDYRKLGETALRSEFGAGYEEARKIANRSLERSDVGKAMAELMKSLGADTHPVAVRYFRAVGQGMSEDHTKQPAPAPPGIDDRMADLRKMYDHPTSSSMFPKPPPQ